jgi:hypothetical protein
MIVSTNSENQTNKIEVSKSSAIWKSLISHIYTTFISAYFFEGNFYYYPSNNIFPVGIAVYNKPCNSLIPNQNSVKAIYNIGPIIFNDMSIELTENIIQ